MANTTKHGGLGWHPSLPDHRNYKWQPKSEVLDNLPHSYALDFSKVPVYDQGQLGSCTANAGSALCQYLMVKEGHVEFMPSRLAIYYWERQIEGTTDSDAGASIADCMKVLTGMGTPPEALWWYNVAKLTIKPNKKVVAAANKHKISIYQSVAQDLNHMKSCIASGYPFIFGFTVYESFESNSVAQTGIVPMPHPSERVLGGHAVCAYEFNDATGYFKIRNSWSSSWGDQGSFYMPYAYISDPNLASDFWTASFLI